MFVGDEVEAKLRGQRVRDTAFIQHAQTQRHFSEALVGTLFQDAQDLFDLLGREQV